MPINFAWNRINLDGGEIIRIEISRDRSFSQGVYIIEDTGSYAQAVFDTGLWHWRCCTGETILRTGQLTVADGSGPELLSPVTNSVFRYKGSLPQIRFQWSERAASIYRHCRRCRQCYYDKEQNAFAPPSHCPHR